MAMALVAPVQGSKKAQAYLQGMVKLSGEAH